MNTARTPDSNANESQQNEIIDLQQRLGDPAQLAALAGQHYRKRSFLGRHPIFTFLLLPVPLIVAGIVGFVLAWMLPRRGALDYSIRCWNAVESTLSAGGYFSPGRDSDCFLDTDCHSAALFDVVSLPNRTTQHGEVRWAVAGMVIGCSMYCALFSCLVAITIENRPATVCSDSDLPSTRRQLGSWRRSAQIRPGERASDCC